jgi:hypothetical protein
MALKEKNMNDIYESPKSELRVDENTEEYGSVEKGITGDYEFSVGGILSEAWAKTSGFKMTAHLALGLYLVGMLVVMIPLGMLAGVPTSTTGILANSLLQQVLLSAVVMPITAGLTIIAIKHSIGRSHTVGEVLGHYGKVIPLLITIILMYVMIVIGFLLLVLPGIYLGVAYYFAIPLVVEKNMGPWEALETSRKAVSKHWFGFFGLFFCVGLINIVAIIPLGLGMIWTVPMSLLAYGIAYRNMFGYRISHR